MTVLFIAAIYVALPAITIWGWWRWAKRRQHIHGWPAKIALVGFTLATLSEGLGIASMAYAAAAGGFAYNDARGAAVFVSGVILALLALALACAGVWRRSLLRWFALYGALATLTFWMAVALVR